MLSWYESFILSGERIRESLERAAKDRLLRRITGPRVRRIFRWPARESLAMARGEAVSLPRGVSTIAVTAGRLWVTLPGDTRDYVLSTGDRLATPGSGRVVVQALTAAVLRVHPAGSGGAPRQAKRSVRRAA